MPVCTACGTDKAVEEFHKDASAKIGRCTRCKECKNARDRGEAVFSDPVPPGFHVKGISTLIGADGSVRGQWLKSNKDEQDRYAALLGAVATIAEPFRGAADPSPVPEFTSGNLLNVIAMGDPHIGMLCWQREVAQAFDLNIAESNLVTAVDHLVGLAPASDECLILNIGDFFHADSASNQTTAGTPQDVDGRWPKVLSVGIRIMRRTIDRALERHRRVTVINEIGNHDEHTSVMLSLCLAAFYEREPRVTIDTSPSKFHYYRFGKCFLMTTHKPKKPENLALVMASDRPQDWGETVHRHIYTGHLHNRTAWEFPGVKLEILPTLAPGNAWSEGEGYRAAQSLQLDTWHRDYGRINQHTVGIRQVWDLERRAA